MAVKKGLGRGMKALLEEEPGAEGSEELVDLTKIEPRPDQPRQLFDEDSLRDLSHSIRMHGLLQPITVRPLADGYYQIVAGERRWRAARMAGLERVPVRVVQADDKKSQELSLVENLQRIDLNPMEEARGYQTLIDTFGMTQELVSESVGRSRSAVANALRLLGLFPSVMELVESGALSAGHARALLPLNQEVTQLAAARRVVNKGLSVRQTEAMVSSLRNFKKEDNTEADNGVDYAQVMSTRLGQALGRRVNIVDGQRRGRVVIEYYGADDREALLSALLGLGGK